MKARDTQRVAEMRQFQTAIEAFFANYGEYPGVEGGHYYTNTGGEWQLRNPTVTDQNDSRLVEFYTDLAEFLPTIPKAIPATQTAYIGSGNSCQISTTGTARIQYRKITQNSYKLATNLEADCQKILNDGGNSTCCSTISGSAGRSYEVYELFNTPSVSNVIPLW